MYKIAKVFQSMKKEADKEKKGHRRVNSFQPGKEIMLRAQYKIYGVKEFEKKKVTGDQAITLVCYVQNVDNGLTVFCF